MSERDGGPAFPFEERNDDGSHYHSNAGMSLRDYLAIHATDRDVAQQIDTIRDTAGRNLPLPANWRTIARYMHADQMLAERAKQEGGSHGD